MEPGYLLTMTEAARVLFGQGDDNARRRALNLLKKNNVQLIRNGRHNLVRRDLLQKTFGVSASDSQHAIVSQALEMRDRLTKGL
tara:strand:- start:1507 stop:1758 length:252 start_codon:yes stop_codon:yes gene_type:complete